MGCNLFDVDFDNRLPNANDNELSDEVTSTLHDKKSCSETATILEDYSTFIKYFDHAFLPNFIPLSDLVWPFKKR